MMKFKPSRFGLSTATILAASVLTFRHLLRLIALN